MVEWKLSPSPALVDGDTVAEFTLLDRGRQPLRGAKLRIEAHMSHPGMAPLVEAATERENGAYVVHLRFPMSGDWILFVKGELADRRPINVRMGETTARGQARTLTPGLTLV